MKQFRNCTLFLVVVLLAFSSCNKDTGYEKLRKNELEILDAYLEEHHPDLAPTPSGLYYIETQKGTGDTIKIGDKVQMFYATWSLLDSNDSLLVDESSGYSQGHRYEPYEFTVGAGNAISGLEEGVTYMQPGGKAKLIINSELAYGQNGSGSVGAFTTLLMEIEIYKVFPVDVP